MLFQTPEFLLLLTITLLIYYRSPDFRLYALALANLLFYGVVGLGAVILFLLITSLSYFLSKQLDSNHKKFFLWLAVLLNVSNLLFFQYSIFVLTSIEQLLSIELLIKNTLLVKLFLPVGISFYSYQD